jgi:hypothetical protein
MVAYRFSTIQAEIGVFRAGRQLKAEGVSGKGKLADSRVETPGYGRAFRRRTPPAFRSRGKPFDSPEKHYD